MQSLLKEKGGGKKRREKKDDSILCLTKHVKDILKYLQMLNHLDCLMGQTSETCNSEVKVLCFREQNHCCGNRTREMMLKGREDF